MQKQLKNIKWQDYSALGLFIALMLIFPITNAIIAGVVNEGLRAFTMMIDTGFTQLSKVGMEVIQSIVTLLIVYVAWRTYGLTKDKMPAKTKNRKTKDRVKAKLDLIED